MAKRIWGIVPVIGDERKAAGRWRERESRRRGVDRGEGLDLEADVDDVAVVHDVVTAFEAELAGFLDLEVGAQFGEILIADDLGANEAPGDIAMDAAGGFECGSAAT